MRWSSVVTLVFVAVGAGTPRTAVADHRCVGWSIPGAIAGSMAGSFAAMVSFKLAGSDVNDPARETRNAWIIGSASLVGATLGPIASCGILGDEPHAIPTATFVIGGAGIGAIGLGAGWFAFDAWRERHRGGTPDDRAARGEGASVLGALLIVVGMGAGGVGGYFLHAHLFRDREVMLVPVATRDISGVGITGAF